VHRLVTCDEEVGKLMLDSREGFWISRLSMIVKEDKSTSKTSGRCRARSDIVVWYGASVGS
jgi:formylmethanofuran dehydrogenase subunit B